MATIVREALNADAMSLAIFCGGAARVGINLSGTWVGTAKFYASNDGVNFRQVSVTPFASGTTVQSATSNGNWFLDVGNYVAVQVVFTRTSGTLVVTLASAADSSWQDAYLVSTSKYVSQSVASGAANAITQAAQANRAWRLKTLVIGFSVAPAAAVDVKVTDGASSVIWETYVPIGATGQVGNFSVPLPAPDPTVPGSGGLVGTPGNSMVVTLAAPGGSVTSTVNCEFAAA